MAAAMATSPSTPTCGGRWLVARDDAGDAPQAAREEERPRRRERPKRASRKKLAPPPTPVLGLPTAPLTRPDGTPAPVVHLVPELSPFARTGGLGEAVASLAKYQAASGSPSR